ncbi:serine hydrolase FSH [Blastocladiella britannica]|nr:serine hydrolase FSH [Blastocladiella britannica]
MDATTTTSIGLTSVDTLARTILSQAATTKMTTSSTAPRLKRILCLHGYTQNATVFRKRTAVLRKHLKNIAEFDYISAPHFAHTHVPTTEAEASSDEGQLAWWTRDHESNAASPAIGIGASLALLNAHIRDHGPYDGVLGFSQGAAMAAVLAMEREQQHTDAPMFYLLVSGFVPRDPAILTQFAVSACTAPSMHIWGTADEWVPPAWSRGLANSFTTAEVFEHAGAHFVPSDGDARKAIAAWIKEQ